MSFLEVFVQSPPAPVLDKTEPTLDAEVSHQASPPRWELEQFWASTQSRRERKLDNQLWDLSLEDERSATQNQVVCKTGFAGFLGKYCEDAENRLDGMGNEPKELEKREVRGKDIGEPDIVYTVEGLHPHELPVIGVFVDPRIYNGFHYKVRPADMPLFHFGGEALKLQMIGRGYGKRLEFESTSCEDDSNNTFWSDSNPEGFAFSIQVLFPGMKFKILEKSKFVPNCVAEAKPELVQGHAVVGQLTVKSVEEVQKELSSKTNFLRDVTKEVAVRGICDIVTQDGEAFEDVKMGGVLKTTVVTVRNAKERKRTEKVLDVMDIKLGKEQMVNCALKLVPQ